MRPLSAALDAARLRAVVRPVYLVRVDFDSGTVAWNTSTSAMEYNGVTYLAGGSLGTVSQVRETPGAKAGTVNITITGVKQDVVALALGQPFLGRKAWVHVAECDDGYALDPDRVFLYFHGKLDAVDGTQGASASFSLAIRSRLADWERPRAMRYSDAEQQKLYPGDKGMEFIPQLSQRKIVWPRAAFLPDPRD